MRRAMAGPEIAPSEMPEQARPTRGSNTTGIGPLGSLRGLSRVTARSPARRPIASAASRSARWRTLMPGIVALHAARLRRRSRCAEQHGCWRHSRRRKPVAGRQRDRLRPVLAPPPSQLVTPETARAASSAASARSLATRPDRVRGRRRGPDRAQGRAAAGPRARGRQNGLRALRAPSRRRGRPARGAKRVRDRRRKRWPSARPTNTRRPISSPSDWSTFSSAPSRTCTSVERSP